MTEAGVTGVGVGEGEPVGVGAGVGVGVGDGVAVGLGFGLAVGVLVAVGYRQTRDTDAGLTTEIAQLIAFLLGGFVGFLPVLGFWMIPLGLIILSIDFKPIRRLRRRVDVWWGRRGRPWWEAQIARWRRRNDNAKG